MRLLPCCLLWFPACQPTPPPFDARAVIQGWETADPAERTCAVAACGDSMDAASLGACRVERCSARPDVWSLVPTTIRHEGETVFVQARLGHEPGGFGDVAATRTTEAYVGVTVVTSTGTEIDLAVTTVFPDALEMPFTLSADVGPDVRDVLFGVWDKKIQPCDSERMGCKQFGFLLDGSLATWPPGLYTEGVRQRIPAGPFRILALDAGAGPAFPARRDEAVAKIRDALAVFGVTPADVQSRIAPDPAPDIALVRDDHDVWLVRGSGLPGRHVPSAEEPIVLVFGGPHHPSARAACETALNAAYDACVAALPSAP